MRTSPDLYARRGGVAYAKDMMRFHKWMLREKWIDKKHFIFCALPHAIVCVIPNCFRKMIYGFLPLKFNSKYVIFRNYVINIGIFINF